MILTGFEDIRVKKTILSIRHAFCEMISEMDYGKMSVKSLCERAMINKKTFYTYYDTLDQLLQEVQDSYSSPFIAEVGAYHLPDDIGRLITQFFAFSARQDKAYEKITCALSYRGIRNEMIEKVMSAGNEGKNDLISSQLTSFENKVMYRFWLESVLMIYQMWINEGKKTPLDDVIDLANGLILDGIDVFTVRK